jgi:hypothetical protein
MTMTDLYRELQRLQDRARREMPNDGRRAAAIGVIDAALTKVHTQLLAEQRAARGEKP